MNLAGMEVWVWKFVYSQTKQKFSVKNIYLSDGFSTNGKILFYLYLYFAGLKWSR